MEQNNKTVPYLQWYSGFVQHYYLIPEKRKKLIILYTFLQQMYHNTRSRIVYQKLWNSMQQNQQYHGICKRLKDISTPDFSTPSFNPKPFNPRLFNHDLFNPGLFNYEFLNHAVEKFIIKKSGVEDPGLKYHLSRRLKDISTLNFSTMNFSTTWFKNSWLKSPELKSSWLKSLGLKLGVEKSGVEMSFNYKITTHTYSQGVCIVLG